MMKNEELFIKSCRTFKTQLICEIEIWHPKTIQTLPVVISVPYFGYSLVGSNGEETFVKGTLSNFYQSLTCQSVPPLHKSYKTCQLNRLPLACATSLASKDYANIVHNCIFVTKCSISIHSSSTYIMTIRGLYAYFPSVHRENMRVIRGFSQCTVVVVHTVSE